jgi:hypothetical protein
MVGAASEEAGFARGGAQLVAANSFSALAMTAVASRIAVGEWMQYAACPEPFSRRCSNWLPDSWGSTKTKQFAREVPKQRIALRRPMMRAIDRSCELVELAGG